MTRLLLAALLFVQAIGRAAQPPPAYLFSYFTNNGEDGLHLLASGDGLSWTAVNGGRSFLFPAVGSRLMRDPSVTRGPDGTFHLVWTTGWWDKGIGVAHSNDLIEWSEQTFLPVGDAIPGAQNCWAPEIFYDADRARFLIFWATTTVREPDASHRIYYVETKDFATYTPARMLFDGGFSVIDAFIVKDGARYVMVMKDETALPSPKKHLRVATASDPAGPWSAASAPISVDWVEGPSVLKKADGWLLMYDEYTRRQYGAMRSTDLSTWTVVGGFALPRGVRHGTAFEVPAGVAERVKAHSTESREERWRLTDGSIEWTAAEVARGPKPHLDHIEMSGLRVSAIIQYGVDRDGRLLLWRRGVWPMLRTIPNDTHASLQQAFGPMDVPRLTIDGREPPVERLRSVSIYGSLTIETELPGLASIARTIYPSRDRPAIIELVRVKNESRAAITVGVADRGLRVTTDPARGVEGAYTIEARASDANPASIAPGGTSAFMIAYTARRAADPAVTVDAERHDFLEGVAANRPRIVLETPDPVLNTAFAFAKIRATDSIFETKGGLMHGPGGGRYYAAIWANDEAEYANPFFAFLGVRLAPPVARRARAVSVEAYPEGGQAHLSAESALYCRVFVEGMFGIRPTALDGFDLTPRLPAAWDRMSLRNVHAFGRVFDVEVLRAGTEVRARIVPDRGAAIERTVPAGGTVSIAFPRTTGDR